VRALILALAACGGATAKPAPAPPPAPAAQAPRWAVTVTPDHFEVDLVRGTQLLAIADGRTGTLGELGARQVQSSAFDPAPELETLDREFAAKSAADGGSAWAAMFAPDGAEWSNGKRVEQAQIGEVMGRVLLGATLAWQPVASGKHGTIGFTQGTYVLASKNSAEREEGSYCTIWRQQPDGSWKIVLDVGSATPR
jgi:ketosteroid isomerase-like protein